MLHKQNKTLKRKETLSHYVIYHLRFKHTRVSKSELFAILLRLFGGSYFSIKYFVFYIEI